MIVKELIELLQTMPEDSIVIMQKDSEGNGYSPLSSVDADTIYAAETTWYGEVYSTNWTAKDTGMDDEEWEDFKERTPKCVVLEPIN